MRNGDTQFTIPGSSLLRLLKNALLFAATDDTLPFICSVQVGLSGITATFTATDRYTLSEETISAEEGTAEGDGTFLLSRKDSKTLIGMKSWDSDYIFVTVTYSTELNTAEFSAGTSGTLSFNSVGGECPHYNKLFDKKTAPSESFGLDREFIARYAKVKVEGETPKNHPPMKVTMTGATPEHNSYILINIGGSFRSVIASCKVNP